ncbi:MAG: hypothetical protein LUG98_13495 [Tannerellaceae bacterium]|nr:hypothetical protein [Tannerellaceae bacterium]
MKRRLLIFITIAIICTGSQEAAASIYIPVGSYEKVCKIKELPRNGNYRTKEGHPLALGIKYTVYQICWLPIYQEGAPEFIGYIDKTNYLPLNESLLSLIAEENNIHNIKELIRLPFWDAWGGKLIAFLLVSMIIGNLFYKKRS